MHALSPSIAVFVDGTFKMETRDSLGTIKADSDIVRLDRFAAFET